MDDLNPLAGTAHLLEEVDSKYSFRPAQGTVALPGDIENVNYHILSQRN